LGMVYYRHESGVMMCRAIVRFDRKEAGEFIRIYPLAEDPTYPSITIENFKQALLAYGMTESRDGLDGIRISKYSYSRGDAAYVMPYLDSPSQMVDERGDEFVIREDGDFECSSTSGYIETHTGTECSDCGDRYDSENEGAYVDNVGDVCQHCLDDHYVNARTGRYGTEYVHQGDVVYCESNGDYYTQYYAERTLRLTESGDWYLPEYVCVTPDGQTHPISDCTPLDHPYNDCTYALDEDVVVRDGETWYDQDPDLPAEVEETESELALAA